MALCTGLDNAGGFYRAGAAFAYGPTFDHGNAVSFIKADGCFGQPDGAPGNMPCGLACGTGCAGLTHGLYAFSQEAAVNYDSFTGGEAGGVADEVDGGTNQFFG